MNSAIAPALLSIAAPDAILPPASCSRGWGSGVYNWKAVACGDPHHQSMSGWIAFDSFLMVALQLLDVKSLMRDKMECDQVDKFSFNYHCCLRVVIISLTQCWSRELDLPPAIHRVLAGLELAICNPNRKRDAIILMLMLKTECLSDSVQERTGDLF